MRPVWFTAGMMALTLGFAGMALPLLPTTPFLILAAFLFSRSSPRFEAWLVEHPAFGPAIRDWRDNRAISPRARKAATLAIAAAFALSVLMALPAWVLAVQAVTLCAVLAFIWTRNTPVRDEA
ncbi:YbaN family protein [Zhengella sp. ZM62]|uniref:YbaN family protein n=1 Tax=Zhengella sedimenti TaxID=3390035 RepID=UPI003975DD3E